MSIETKNIVYIYGEGSPFETTALDGVNINIEKGDFAGIIGQTGSGKSTFIQLLNGLEKPSSGEVIVDDEKLSDKSTSKKKIRTKVGLVFQYPEYQLFEETVEKDVAFGPKNQGLVDDELRERVIFALEQVGIDYDEFKDLSPFDLSGGQKRKVAIAGVIAMKPDYLILDEPAAGLDPAGRNEMFESLTSMHKAGQTVVLVSHSMEDIAKLVDKVFVFFKGKIQMEGTPREVYSNYSKLIDIGLGVPQIVDISNKLRNRGFDISHDVITIEEVKEAILKNLKQKNELNKVTEEDQDV